MSNPMVAVVGRPNVGKSTLFNRLVGKRIAIVEDVPGVTRDRLYAEAEWLGRNFMLIDTGGLILNEKDPLTVQVRTQAEIAISEADVIVFLVDVTEGVTPADMEVADVLRRTRKPVLVAVNKVDNERLERESIEFFSLGLGDIYPISSLHGRGVAELLDKIIENLPVPTAEKVYSEEVIKIAIIGRPNVGKSSLLNAIIKEERAIVSDIPGTTRDAIDTYFEHGDQRFVLIDTAGIRRAGKIQRSIEYYSVLRAVRALERADVALVVIDASEGVVDGDKRVAGYSHDAGKAAVIVVNKWDLAKKQGKTINGFTELVRREMPFMNYAPIVFTSAIEGTGITELLGCAAIASQNHALRLPTGELNRLIGDIVDARPYSEKGKEFRVYYATMPSVRPPTIVLFTNDPDLLHFSYQRYIENQLRKHYTYEGTPIRIFARKAEHSRPH
ncbi:MAG: ribosome biogenesis GTPase Der [Armatimonadota bacterium]|nr:ribosome biogenesis GTPase Der [Armatimonadota bacterium]